MSLIAYSYPDGFPRSTLYRVWVNGQALDVASTEVGDFVSLAFDEPVEVEVEINRAHPEAVLRPVSRGIVTAMTGNRWRWTMPGPLNLCLESHGLRPLFFYASSPTEPPTGPGVKHYRAGQIHEVGELTLGDGETLYIEGGAVVRGRVRVTGANNVRLAGHGILDGGYPQQVSERRRLILFDNCEHCRVEDLILVRPATWMVTLGGSRDMLVRGVRELGECGGSDGVDIVGAQRVRVENCFLRNGDDCVAVKAIDFRETPQVRATTDWRQNVEDVEVRGCVFLGYQGATTMEIGFETRCDLIHRVRFVDCDVLGVHGHGSVFGIHNGDHATVSDVLWENIRVEHHYDKLLEFRVLVSRWNKDTERGHIRRVRLKNIRVARSIYNPGYTVSLIGGWDANHPVEDVAFVDFQIDGRPVTNGDELDLFTRQARRITFR